MSRTIYALLVGIDGYRRRCLPLERLRQRRRGFRPVSPGPCGRRRRARARAEGLEGRRRPPATRSSTGFRDTWARRGQGRRGAVLLQRARLAGAGAAGVLAPRARQARRDPRLLRQPRARASWDLADKELAKLIDEVAASGAARRRDPRLLPLGLGHAERRRAEDGRAPSPTDLRPGRSSRSWSSLTEAQRLSGQARRRTTDRHGLAGGPARPARRLPRRRRRPRSTRATAARAGRSRYFLGDTLRNARPAADLPRPVRPHLRPGLQPGPGTSRPSSRRPAPRTSTRSSSTGPSGRQRALLPVSRDGPGWRSARAAPCTACPAASAAAPEKLALFPVRRPPSDLRDRAKAVGEAQVVEVGPTSSRVERRGRDARAADLQGRVTSPAAAGPCGPPRGRGRGRRPGPRGPGQGRDRTAGRRSTSARPGPASRPNSA